MGLPPRVYGMWDAFLKIWSTGGVRGLWKGEKFWCLAAKNRSLIYLLLVELC